ncbi:MAG: rhodanese-like domain-containing protein [Brevundimonas sp.]|jgi:rhodanese-related sulfurtransferase|uniref:rhodanese-like domain-containing protein n=1 Tax=Brevundimonas sp. TaxID=1871086 RepID=UPI0025C013BE|nr:rhodanese-like domain-containing protein [Brevundimonas sp.]MCH4269702.1 rhodanese-like domain-containing protein [Brevundimonas sp.]
MSQDLEVKILSPQQIDAVRAAGNTQIVDVRLPFDFFGGRLPGSINVPGNALATTAGAIPLTRKLIVVCDDGQASLKAAQAAVAAGFVDVSVLEGGFDAWSEADLPVETVSDGIPSPLSLQAEAGD